MAVLVKGNLFLVSFYMFDNTPNVCVYSIISGSDNGLLTTLNED